MQKKSNTPRAMEIARKGNTKSIHSLSIRIPGKGIVSDKPNISTQHY